MGLLTWWFTPAESWLPTARLTKVREIEEYHNDSEMSDRAPM